MRWVEPVLAVTTGGVCGCNMCGAVGSSVCLVAGE